MHRFYLSPEITQTDQIIFPVEISRQISRVLRLKPEQCVQIFDGLGQECEVCLEQVDSNQVVGRVLSRRACQTEPRARLTLYLALTQREKFEWMLQKGTEVGVYAFVPFISTYSLVQKADESKLPRWNEIIREAVEQSGRCRLPGLSKPVNFQAAVAGASVHPLALMAWEKEEALGLKTALAGLAEKDETPDLAMMIGPEGGFSAEEAGLARAAGVKPVSLGRRILRMETAAVVAAALVLFELGDLG
jgi:16S rRNA (uracil1498-N3)-methyltransferase